MTAQQVELSWSNEPYMWHGHYPALPKRLLLKGWSKEPTDFCWMDCSRPGHSLRLPSGWEITLCSAHIKQLDRAAEEVGGYSKAGPPPHSKADAWPWGRWTSESGGPPVFEKPGPV